MIPFRNPRKPYFQAMTNLRIDLSLFCVAVRYYPLTEGTTILK